MFVNDSCLMSFVDKLIQIPEFVKSECDSAGVVMAQYYKNGIPVFMLVELLSRSDDLIPSKPF